jgi:hypothetical protein
LAAHAIHSAGHEGREHADGRPVGGLLGCLAQVGPGREALPAAPAASSAAAMMMWARLICFLREDLRVSASNSVFARRT